MKILLFTCVLCIRTLLCDTRPWDYAKDKQRLQKQEMDASVGGTLELNDEEEQANKILMYHKNKELDIMYRDPKNFYFKNNFLQYKQAIQKSKVYKIIKSMPKGGALHLHNSAMLDADSLIELTYEKHAYVCFHNNSILFQFSLNVPTNNCSANWTLLEELRNNTSDVQAFDNDLKKYFVLDFDGMDNSDIDTVWEHFEQVISNIQTLIKYRPVYEKFYYRAFKNFFADKVKYMEIRGGFSSCYELDGTVRDSHFVINMLNRVIEEFKQEYPSFLGVKLIVTKHRGNNQTRVIERALNLIHTYPDMVVGFDLVGQEDKGRPLSDFTRVFTDYKDDINFYFHAGETNWLGATDDNLYDSILLHTKRIGHAFALAKHPILMKIVKEQDIALEVNVVSNAVLGLVKDMRNHPAALFLAEGMPVVISSDDPGVWGADPLSHDYFITFMVIASRRADLRMLKQLALNSIKYSALDEETQCEFEKKFHKSWMKFIRFVNKNFYDIKKDEDDYVKRNSTNLIIKTHIHNNDFNVDG